MTIDLPATIEEFEFTKAVAYKEGKAEERAEMLQALPCGHWAVCKINLTNLTKGQTCLMCYELDKAITDEREEVVRLLRNMSLNERSMEFAQALQLAATMVKARGEGF